jgi:hypothetical protein
MESTNNNDSRLERRAMATRIKFSISSGCQRMVCSMANNWCAHILLYTNLLALSSTWYSEISGSCIILPQNCIAPQILKNEVN